ncbi:hypothetical protein TIFTF001_034063 [Ficus carica]|uniref:Uncharacterized protein n=1 Tax=Ficus carica TaxID=3494 RepID=A0AA88DZ65_FICCA|nr:hypothetical protein TIFTF001_034063 [Ficus carica]
MDPAQVAEDRRSITSFYKSQPLLFDGMRRIVSLAAWLYDTELIFRTSHIVERLQVFLASRCLVANARLWWRTHPTSNGRNRELTSYMQRFTQNFH